MKAIAAPVYDTVHPGSEVDVTMKLVAPQLPGKYCAFFRFMYGDQQRFGQKVWADILVEDTQEEVFKSFANPVN